MKRMLCAILGILLLSAVEAAAEEAPGFGFINMRDTVLQEEPGGETLYSLPRDTCVWIRDSVTDPEGNEWLAVNTGLWKKPGEDLTGWVCAEQVDSGEEVWHDVVSVSADECGMIALKADGTAETAGRIYPPLDPMYGPTARRWTYRCGTIMQVQAWVGGYAARMEDGSVTNTAVGIPYYPSGKEFRLLAEHSCQFGISAKNELTDMCEPATRLTWYWPENAPSRKTISRVVSLDCQHGWLAMLTDSGELLAAKCWESSGEEPVWSQWRDMETFHMKDNSRWTGDSTACEWMMAGVKKDGTAQAWPEMLENVLTGWTDLADIQLGTGYALGLKKDGTAVSAGLPGTQAPDVSGWRNVTAIAAGRGFCVGITESGGLVFAGEARISRKQ